MAAGRTRVNGVGRQQKQNKRAATSFQDKLEVIQHYESSHDMQTTVRKFYPDLNETERRAKARVVYRWLQLKDSIATHANSAKTKNQSRIRNVGSATTLGVEGERQLVAWLKQMRRAGEQVSSEMLRAKAMQVAKERNVPEGAFAASGTWQKSFLDRNKKSLRDDAEDGGGVDSVERALGGDATGHGVVAVNPNTNTTTSKQNETPGPDARSNGSERNDKELPQTQVLPAPSPSTEANKLVQQRPEVKQPQAATVAVVTAAPAVAAIPAARVAVVAEQQIPTPVKIASVEPVAVAPAVAATPVEAAQPVAVAAAIAVADSEEHEIKKRKAEIEDRKAELLNESIRCDNVLKKIKIAEENMLARKRLRDAGIPQEEIDALLPVQRE